MQNQQRSALGALVLGKCPRCKQGNVFSAPWTHIHQFSRMNKVCDQCGFNFEPEPMFYFGAMYISYAFSVAALVACYIALRVILGNPPMIYFIIAVPSVVLLTLPFNFRYSRLIYLYLAGAWRNR